MLIKKQERQRFENSKQCTAYEYPFEDPDIDVALIEIRGRYPDKGYAINTQVKEMIFVVKGKGHIVIEDKRSSLEEGAAVLVLPQKKYVLEGDFTLVISCNPAWSPKQHQTLEM
ncbi:MAG: hypothetical protein K940chlam8_00801 [Chlamydiae bacterium]|nr:hypothetical protein [Chlamydiota bacterium]